MSGRTNIPDELDIHPVPMVLTGKVTTTPDPVRWFVARARLEGGSASDASIDLGLGADMTGGISTPPGSIMTGVLLVTVCGQGSASGTNFGKSWLFSLTYAGDAEGTSAVTEIAACNVADDDGSGGASWTCVIDIPDVTLRVRVTAAGNNTIPAAIGCFEVSMVPLLVSP